MIVLQESTRPVGCVGPPADPGGFESLQSLEGDAACTSAGGQLLVGRARHEVSDLAHLPCVLIQDAFDRRKALLRRIALPGLK